MKNVIVGIIGAGRIGRLHAENLKFRIKGVTLKSIADAFLNENIIKWAREIGITNVTDDANDIISDPEIDVVLICSSTSTHGYYIKECAKAGKDVFCEKPIADRVEEILDALKAVEEYGVRLQVGFVRRFDHNHKKVHDIVADGTLGKPYIVKVTSRDPALPSMEYLESSGGLFFDMTIHDFDMVRFLSGSEPVEIFAFAEALVDQRVSAINDVDTAIVTIHFENGMLGVIDNCRRADYGYDQRTEVHGELGCVYVKNDNLNEAYLCTNSGIHKDPHPWFFLERYNDAFISEIECFLDAHRNKSEPLVTGIDGLVPVKMAIAAYKSLREKRSVRMNEI